MNRETADRILTLLDERTRIDAKKQDLREQKGRARRMKDRAATLDLNNQILRLQEADRKALKELTDLGFAYGKEGYSREELLEAATDDRYTLPCENEHEAADLGQCFKDAGIDHEVGCWPSGNEANPVQWGVYVNRDEDQERAQAMFEEWVCDRDPSLAQPSTLVGDWMATQDLSADFEPIYAELRRLSETYEIPTHEFEAIRKQLEYLDQ
jgi:hypothetical protein